MQFYARCIYNDRLATVIGLRDDSPEWYMILINEFYDDRLNARLKGLDGVIEDAGERVLGKLTSTVEKSVEQIDALSVKYDAELSSRFAKLESTLGSASVQALGELSDAIGKRTEKLDELSSKVLDVETAMGTALGAKMSRLTEGVDEVTKRMLDTVAQSVDARAEDIARKREPWV